MTSVLLGMALFLFALAFMAALADAIERNERCDSRRRNGR